MTFIPEEIRKQLSTGERVLWSGRPRQGITLRGSDVLMIPFSLLWGGFAIFWESTAVNSNAPAFFALWGVPFVLMGLYMILGRFFFEAKQREETFYAVTNERVVIVSGVLGRTIKSLNLRTLSDLSLTEGKGNEGTILLSAPSLSSAFGGISGWPGMNTRQGPRFELIENARAVYEVIRQAQREAT